MLEQTAPGRFVRHSLEAVTCDHSTCDLGDFDADGKVDFVTGNHLIQYGGIPIEDQPDVDWVILRRNLGRPDSEKPPNAGTIRPH
jgi:hypothetical protein